jgi:hypothetical protein
MFGYFGAKLRAEQIVADSGLPWTTLRATQFHELTLTTVRQMAKLPVIPVPFGFRFQPVDAGEVAARLVELAVGTPAGLVPDMGGPRVYAMADLVRGYLRASGKRRPILLVRVPGKAARALREGANLIRTGPSATGRGRSSWPRTWARRATTGPTRRSGWLRAGMRDQVWRSSSVVRAAVLSSAQPVHGNATEPETCAIPGVCRMTLCPCVRRRILRESGEATASTSMVRASPVVHGLVPVGPDVEHRELARLCREIRRSVEGPWQRRLERRPAEMDIHEQGPI